MVLRRDTESNKAAFNWGANAAAHADPVLLGIVSHPPDLGKHLSRDLSVTLPSLSSQRQNVSTVPRSGSWWARSPALELLPFCSKLVVFPRLHAEVFQWPPRKTELLSSMHLVLQEGYTPAVTSWPCFWFWCDPSHTKTGFGGTLLRYYCCFIFQILFLVVSEHRVLFWPLLGCVSCG